MEGAIAHSLGNLQIAATLGIEDQVIGEGVAAQRLQRRLHLFLSRFQIFQQAPSGANRQG